MEEIEGPVVNGFTNSIKYRIIFPKDDGTLGVIVPMHPELTVEQIALKDVPEGKPFKIVETKSLPTDTTFRDAWTYNFSKPDGHGMNNEEFYNQYLSNSGNEQ